MCQRLLRKQEAYLMMMPTAHCIAHISIPFFGVILIIVLFWPAGVMRQFLKSPEICKVISSARQTKRKDRGNKGRSAVKRA